MSKIKRRTLLKAGSASIFAGVSGASFAGSMIDPKKILSDTGIVVAGDPSTHGAEDVVYTIVSGRLRATSMPHHVINEFAQKYAELNPDTTYQSYTKVMDQHKLVNEFMRSTNAYSRSADEALEFVGLS